MLRPAVGQTLIYALILNMVLAILPEPAFSQDLQTASGQTPVEPLKDPNRPIRDKWAVVVGIGKFQNSKIPSLKFATKDARDFYNYLINDARFSRDHVRLLLDEQASQRRILSEVGSKFLARLAKEDDLIVLFFSTHGSPSQLDVRGTNYIVAHDSDPDDLFVSGIEMQKILDSISRRVLSDRVLLILDACHSGSVDPNAKGIARVANFDAAALAQGSGQMVICSSSPDQQSWESKRYDNGVFTKQLLEGLRTNQSIVQAYDAMKNNVADEVQEDYPGMRQTPLMHSTWSGANLVVAVKPNAPQAIPQTVLDELQPDSTGLAQERNPQTVVATSSIRVPIQQQSQVLQMQTPLGKDTDPAQRNDNALVLTRAYFSDVPNPEKAFTAAAAAQAAHFNDLDYYWRKVKILIQLGKWKKAMLELNGLITDSPNKFEYYLARAFCFHMLKEDGLADGDIRFAQFKNPTLPAKIEFAEHP